MEASGSAHYQRRRPFDDKWALFSAGASPLKVRTDLLWQLMQRLTYRQRVQTMQKYTFVRGWTEVAVYVKEITGMLQEARFS